MAEPVEYTDDVDESWADTAVERMGVAVTPSVEHPLVLDLAGPCPRCGDAMAHAHWLITLRGVPVVEPDDAIRAGEALRHAGIGPGSLLPAEFPVQCRCDGKHPDPLGRTRLQGCGARWRMRFEEVDGEVKTVRAVPPHDRKPDPRQIGDRERLAEEVTDSLTRIRTTAENWRNGMAGLVALVTTTLVFKGRDSITAYGTPIRIALGLLTGLALVAGVTALLRFLRAAYGVPEVVSTASVIDEGGVDVRNVRLAHVALDDLNAARRLALGSAVLLAAALLLSWYGPTRSTAPMVEVVVRGEPQPVCGALKAQDGATTVLQVAGEPSERRLPTPDLVSTVLVEKC
ncbi:hypothetical protein ACIQMJ_26810 [Actinosynnema sp. NPDC091369]